MLLSYLGQVGVDGSRHLYFYLIGNDGESSICDFCHYVIHFPDNGVVDGVVEFGDDVVKPIIDRPQDGIEWVDVRLIDGVEWMYVRLIDIECRLMRVVVVVGLMRVIVIVEEIRDWEEWVIIGKSSRRTGAAQVSWDGHNSADRSCTAMMAVPGAVRHNFCEAVRGDLILGDLVVRRTESYSGHVHHGTGIVVVGSSRAGSACLS